MRRCAAQALVESALVLPLLILTSLSVLQVVLYAHAHDVLVSAVQEGARLSAEDGRSLDEGFARVGAFVRAGLGTSVDPVQVGGSADDELITFRADAALRPIVPLPLIASLPIHAEGHVARERFRPGGVGR